MRVKFRPRHKRHAVWGRVVRQEPDVLLVVTDSGFYSVAQAAVIDRKGDSEACQCSG